MNVAIPRLHLFFGRNFGSLMFKVKLKSTYGRHILAFYLQVYNNSTSFSVCNVYPILGFRVYNDKTYLEFCLRLCDDYVRSILGQIILKIWHNLSTKTYKFQPTLLKYPKYHHNFVGTSFKFSTTTNNKKWSLTTKLFVINTCSLLTTLSLTNLYK